MKVYLLASTTLEPDFYTWISTFKQGWTGESTNGGEILAEAAAKRCYRSFDVSGNKNLTKVRDQGTLANVLKSKHGSILEHVNLTFAFEGVSRVFTHELVRHRAGCAYSQESLRYCRIEDFEIDTPENVDSHIFETTVERIRGAISALASNIDPDMDFAEKKKLTSAIRRIAPMGLKTGIVCTFNMRALRHIMIMRTSKGAEVEIREVFLEVWHIVSEKYPLLVSDMQLVNGEVIGEKI